MASSRFVSEVILRWTLRSEIASLRAADSSGVPVSQQPHQLAFLRLQTVRVAYGRRVERRRGAPDLLEEGDEPGEHPGLRSSSAPRREFRDRAARAPSHGRR
ncbi:hypothetical protein GCM10020358_75260 [Amorphoplanes nipponensis]